MSLPTLLGCSCAGTPGAATTLRLNGLRWGNAKPVMHPTPLRQPLRDVLLCVEVASPQALAGLPARRSDGGSRTRVMRRVRPPSWGLTIQMEPGRSLSCHPVSSACMAGLAWMSTTRSLRTDEAGMQRRGSPSTIAPLLTSTPGSRGRRLTVRSDGSDTRQKHCAVDIHGCLLPLLAPGIPAWNDPVGGGTSITSCTRARLIPPHRHGPFLPSILVLSDQALNRFICQDRIDCRTISGSRPFVYEKHTLKLQHFSRIDPGVQLRMRTAVPTAAQR